MHEIFRELLLTVSLCEVRNVISFRNFYLATGAIILSFVVGCSASSDEHEQVTYPSNANDVFIDPATGQNMEAAFIPLPDWKYAGSACSPMQGLFPMKLNSGRLVEVSGRISCPQGKGDPIGAAMWSIERDREGSGPIVFANGQGEIEFEKGEIYRYRMFIKMPGEEAGVCRLRIRYQGLPDYPMLDEEIEIVAKE